MSPPAREHDDGARAGGLERLERLYEKARHLPEAERTAFLDEHCAGDPALRSELESLLTVAAEAEEFMEALGRVAEPADSAEVVGRLRATLPPGAVIGRYRVLERIGAGGMGIVYRARDPVLGREVALKLLPPHGSDDEGARQRFLREARAAAALDHPHICTLHEIGEAEDGSPFLAMALYRGETLKQRLARGPLPLDEAVRYATAVASGLAAAHARGIVHRDVKPGNIMLSSDGGVKLLDFGLAKLGDITLTRPGLTPGTVAYMSPEQVRSRRVDPRTDLWSLGVVLYEMLCGERPFRGDADAVVLNAIANLEPSPVRSCRPETPERLALAVERLLRKDPADRFASAEELITALNRTAAPEQRAPAGRRRMPPRPARRLLAMAVAVVLVPAVAWLFANRETDATRPATDSAAPAVRILVADFANFTPDSLLGDAVSSALRVDLARSPSLQVAGVPTIAAALGRMRRNPGARLDAGLALEIALREGIRAVVDGEVRRAGAAWVISVRLVEAATGEVVDGWRESAVDSAAILPAIERLSAGIRSSMAGSLGTIPAGTELYPRTTGSLEALRAYSEGNRAHFGGDYTRALALYEEAVRLDSAFAAAWTMVAYELEGMRGSPGRLRRAHANAYRFRHGLAAAERHAAEGNYSWFATGDLPRTINAFRHQVEAARATGDVSHYATLGRALLLAGDLAGAEAVLREARDVYPTAANHHTLVQTLYRRGELEEAAAAVEDPPLPNHPLLGLVRAQMAAASWDFEAAADLASRLPASVGIHTGPRLEALAIAGQGRLRDALDRLGAIREDLLRTGHAGAAAETAVAMGRLHLVRGDTAAALAEVDLFLERQPLEALDPLDRPYLSMARFMADARVQARARGYLADWERETPEEFHGADRWTWLRARAALHVAEGRPNAALSDLDRASRAFPVSAPFEDATIGMHERPETARAWLLAGQPDSAIAIYERYVALHSMERLGIDPFELPPTLMRLPGLLEARGDSAAARAYRSRLAELWRNADPELRRKAEGAGRNAGDSSPP